MLIEEEKIEYYIMASNTFHNTNGLLTLQCSLNIIQKVVYHEADTKNSMCQTEQDQKSDISNMTTQKLKIKKRVPEA